MAIYIRNLSLTATQEDLINLFAEFGAVRTAEIAVDSETNVPKGFALVQMVSSQEAEKAIYALDGTEFQGKLLRIKEEKRMDGLIGRIGKRD